jgi:hypothetical protein
MERAAQVLIRLGVSSNKWICAAESSRQRYGTNPIHIRLMQWSFFVRGEFILWCIGVFFFFHSQLENIFFWRVAESRIHMLHFAPPEAMQLIRRVCVCARATENKIYRSKLVTDGCQRMFCALAARRRWLLRRRCEINSASRPVKKEEYVFSVAERGKHTAQFRWKAELRLRTRMAIYTLARVAR